MEIRSIFSVVKYIEKLGFSPMLTEILDVTVTGLIIVLLAFASDFITKRILLRIVSRLVKRSKSDWDDILINSKVLKLVAHLAPALVVYYSLGYALSNHPEMVSFMQSAIYIYIIIVALLAIDALISGLHNIYQTLEISKTRPIKGYVQVVKIILYFIGIILILSIILNKEVGYFFTGLGALAAVLLLVFKDTILGFVASIQLSANKMIRIGDWITMPKYNADGTVIELTLNTVKVQNWDKTICTIPIYALVSESFSNWRGMEESGGRRIKRFISIDMKSVKFCTKEMLEKFRKITLLKPYIEDRLEEIENYNKQNSVDETTLINGRRLTNLGTFRKYIELYLQRHPKIHQEMTFLVRHLQPTEKGLPIEIYVFSNDQAWANYESIQADIFDHIIAVIPEFELRVFQLPTGDDMQKISLTAVD